MQLVSVNIGSVRPMPGVKAHGVTGIYKQPSDGAVWIGRLGLARDAVCDTDNHGGPDQAVYVYGTPDYQWWETELGRALEPGTFGENLTIDGLESAALNIGDRLIIGDVTLEVTAPRIPCRTLSTRMQDPLFVRRFRAAERPGLYCRVIAEGEVRAGDAVRLESYRGATVSALEMFRDFFEPDSREATIQRYLAAPIALRARADKEAQLATLALSSASGTA